MLVEKLNTRICRFFLVFIFLMKATDVRGVDLENEKLAAYLLSDDHWLYANLDKIFSQGDVLKNSKTFKEAGFITLYKQPSGMMVAKHHALPGYLVKVYFYSSPQCLDLQWLMNRCEGAENIRNLIKTQKLKFFSVPDKWIYFLPNQGQDVAILVVQDMKLVSKEESKKAWKNASKQQLKELYVILSHGFGSCFLYANIPYTKTGKFSCVDTAYPHRQHLYSSIKKHISADRYEYWDQMVKAGENK